MDVSETKKFAPEIVRELTSEFAPETPELEGQKLLDAVASLTGLPASIAHGELNQILESTGQKNGEVTLETLRAAMLEYLQTLNDDLASDSPASAAGPSGARDSLGAVIDEV